MKGPFAVDSMWQFGHQVLTAADCLKPGEQLAQRRQIPGMQHQHRPNPGRLGGWCQLGRGQQLQLWLGMKMEGQTDLCPDPGMSWLLQLSASPVLAGLLTTWLTHWSCMATVQSAMQTQSNSSYLLHHTVCEGSACICPCSICLSVCGEAHQNSTEACEVFLHCH